MDGACAKVAGVGYSPTSQGRVGGTKSGGIFDAEWERRWDFHAGVAAFPSLPPPSDDGPVNSLGAQLFSTGADPPPDKDGGGAMAVPRDDHSRARLILLFSLRMALLGAQLFLTGADPPPTRTAVA